ncbi:fumarylacetoacetate hydrolase family protein [Kineococcus sp. SYSU DK004]|uniref:fumarylacetoacetate hydrolase family protein n=1 Tax=Kineococcus sp. SYSU DK004 TaxID=3383125 RepID=UPI003D7C8D5D
MSTPHPVDPADALPADPRALLVGRVHDPVTGGPVPVAVRGGELVDLSGTAPTVAHLLRLPTPRVREAVEDAPARWDVREVLAASLGRDTAAVRLLAPVDLQVVKACGVTFVDSMLERVIEERCAGDPDLAQGVRAQVLDALGDVGDLSAVVPGSAQAARVKEALLARGMWSQYLEVGLGPDPEVFTKAPVLSSVGYGERVGIPATSSWNNPEPELVLVVDAEGVPRGATLGNDVNLRDVEGRSALLLGAAKDNTASSALGPFVRLFDDGFTLDDARTERISLRVDGPEGYLLEAVNDVGRLSRSFEELVAATWGPHHQYPDGFVLHTGTLFAPVQDRGEHGRGFTHVHGDVVTIAGPHLGALVNEVGPTEQLPPWEWGVGRLLDHLLDRAAQEAGRRP